MSASGRSIYRTAYELSPIILTNGLASALPFQMLPIAMVTQASSFVQGVLQGSDAVSSDDYFAHFEVLPGATLISQQVGTYPFANQTVAANAVMTQPLNVSLLMTCPAQGEGGYAKKMVTMTSLKKTLDAHNIAGGSYTVVTPSYIYTGCLLTAVRDVSSGEGGKQKQTQWQLDFVQPLLSQAAALGMLSAMMSKAQGNIPSSGSWSGLLSSSFSTMSGVVSAFSGSSGNVGSLVGSSSSATATSFL